MNKHILSPASRSCTGCGACSAACPHEAIRMTMGDKGFFVPMVDEEKCVDCGLCQKVCYRFQEVGRTTAAIAHNAVLGAHSTRQAVQAGTTSGGIAYEIACWGLEHGYHILGTVYELAAGRARAVLVRSLKELPALTGSKYLQSATAEAFSQLLAEAKQDAGQKYICIGTPCQIYGLRRLLDVRRLTNEVLYVDLFCHGVPSYLVWQPYLKEKERRLGTMTAVNFRSKRNGWHQYTIELRGQRGTYWQFAYKDRFYRYFFDNIALNTSCYTCLLRQGRVAADLRLGDFLGGAYEGREDGVSAVLLVSDRGRRLMETLQHDGRITVDREWPAEACLRSQSTHPYTGLQLRLQQGVLQRLHDGKSLRSVQRWYFQRLPLTAQVQSVLKRGVASLPLPLLLWIRRRWVS